MDRLTSDQALNTYENISMNYTLESSKFLQVSAHVYSEIWPTPRRFSAICCDLVNCYHLLLCCIDYGYCAALAAKRTDLFDPKFYEAQQDKLKRDSDNQDVGIIRELVKSHDGNFEDASVLKAHHFRHPIQQLMEEKRALVRYHLKAGAACITETGECVAVVALEMRKKLNKTYEEGVLKEGELDERIFLDENSQDRIGTPRHTLDSVQRELRMCKAATVVKGARETADPDQVEEQAEDTNKEPVNLPGPSSAGGDCGGGETQSSPPELPELRRSTRQRRPPDRY
ncbi:hypothetical protein HPB51_009051 [Rhipicephalus microplus]|uniref:Uncharacterized protein n=1 Tax=Rhipicephalus microplus TaxID=6941 RepID=A0A9J6D908_RHIMP|nr:hypothetical protein HPB51_009051 [Rhipicephalus microplus]